MNMKKIHIMLGALLLALLPAGLISCRKTGGGTQRGDFIRVYDAPDAQTSLEKVTVSVKGGTYTYYIRSNVSFSAEWQSEERGWVEIGAPKQVEEGLWSIDLSVKPIDTRSYAQAGSTSPTGLYSRRYGVLKLSCQSQYLGNFLVVEQGLENRIACDFSWLYGSADPNATYNDVLISDWNTAQLKQGYTSTLIKDEEQCWVYAKDGYVKLGNDQGAGADLITPHTADFQYDTLLVVSFRAVVQNGDVLPDYTGGTEPIVPMHRPVPFAGGSGNAVDANMFTVQVTGGGYIRDFAQTGGTSLDLELPTYDRNSPAFPADMFDGASFLVFIEGSENNPITVNTALRFVAGSMASSGTEPCNRVFLDDIFVYRQSPVGDEDLFLANGSRSGKDIICGGNGHE